MELASKTGLVAAACLGLSACGTATPETGPGPVSAVSDLHGRAERSLAISWRAFEALLAAVDALQKNGVIKSGSPAALRLAALIERARAALASATSALRMGDGAGLAESLGRARSALGEAKAVLGGSA